METRQGLKGKRERQMRKAREKVERESQERRLRENGKEEGRRKERARYIYIERESGGGGGVEIRKP